MSNPAVVTLMFHRVNESALGYCPQQFAKYLDYLVKHFPIVIPGQPLPKVPIAICLTFDDAYFDFYHHVYPLLQKHQIKALLAVPTHYIAESTDLSPNVRLSVPYGHDMANPEHLQKVPFCTWQELKEMAQSNLVVMASHGCKHANLAKKATDLTQEIIVSQDILQQHLNVPVRNFVYPYGCLTPRVHRTVRSHYDFGIRIGSALNLGWNHPQQFIYRINADPLWTRMRPIGKFLVKKLTLKYWMNRLRLK